MKRVTTAHKLVVSFVSIPVQVFSWNPARTHWTNFFHRISTWSNSNNNYKLWQVLIYEFSLRESCFACTTSARSCNVIIVVRAFKDDCLWGDIAQSKTVISFDLWGEESKRNNEILSCPFLLHVLCSRKNVSQFFEIVDVEEGKLSNIMGDASC